jgi:hypothetical protein
MQVVLATLLQRFHIALKYGHPEPTEQYTLGMWPDSVEIVLTSTGVYMYATQYVCIHCCMKWYAVHASY